MYRLKKDVAHCTRHKDFITEKEIGLKGEKLEKEYANSPYVTQAYLNEMVQYFRGGIDRPPWHTLFIDGLTGDKDEKEDSFAPLFQGGDIS